MATDYTSSRRALSRRLLLLAVALAVPGLCCVSGLAPVAGQGVEELGNVERDVKSEYSQIRIRKVKNVRTLFFIRDSGEEVVESMVDLDKPHELLVPYTQYMFLSYLFRPKQEKVLIVGLGGGSMIHFLRKYDQKVNIDVVEIDPAIVSLADKCFGVRSGQNVNIMTKDAFAYFKNTDSHYDVIYMDAFLKPSRDTDKTGVPLRLKTIRFYRDLQKRLTPDGMVVFNINPHPAIEEDVRTIREAFPQTYVFALPKMEGLVVVGSMAEQHLSLTDLAAGARAMDRRFKTTFSFHEMSSHLVP